MIGPTTLDSAKTTPKATGVIRSMIAKAATVSCPNPEKTRIE